MVVAHATADPSSQSSPTKRKNRRKLHKNPAAPLGKAFPNPTTSPSNKEPLTDITEKPSSPIDTSSLFPLPKTTTHADDDDELMIDASAPSLIAPTSAVPIFPPAAPSKKTALLAPENRRVPIPPHRMTPLKKDWINIFGPLTEILGLQVRMNVQRRCVEVRVTLISIILRSKILNLLYRLQNSQKRLAQSKKVPTSSKPMRWAST
jgi:RNA-binding protein PNO1